MDLRFDDAYGKVYEYDSEAEAYIFIGTYYAYGITAKMDYQEKKNIVEQDS